MDASIYYITAFLLAFALAGVTTALLIPRLRRMKMGQRILEIGPVWHAKKEGTPTMGGISFLFATLAAALLLLPFLTRVFTGEVIYALFLTLAFCLFNGAAGIADDMTKLRHHRNEGLSPTQKLILQAVGAAAYLILLRAAGFVGEELLLSRFGVLPLGFATYFVLMLLILGTVNCTNLTDGIDGLAAGVCAVIFAAYALFAAAEENVAGALLACLFLGCALSFLFFNRHPAKIFMGDTGSLFLGAGVVSVPLLLKNHLLPLLCGIIFVVEGCSVILQVVYYKATHKRLFLMAPLHHHLEKCGWSENKIVLLFSGATLLACLVARFL